MIAGIPPDLEFTKIHDLVVRSRLVNRAVVEDVSRRLAHGEYCLILGPRFCEKSLLLSDIHQRLGDFDGATRLLIDLGEFRHDTGARFINRFATAIREAAGTGSAGRWRGERQFHQFLAGIPRALETPVILLLDHLELLPVNDIVILLRVLRTVFTEQRPVAHSFPLTCAVASSFSVADLIFEPNSPFNEGFKMWVGDLDRVDSALLVSNIAATLEVGVEEGFVDRLFASTNGDRYLIALLCNCCARIARQDGRNALRSADMDSAERWFLENVENVANYPPLQETMRALEQSPETLRTFMQVLKAGRMRESELEIRADERPDALRLTGGVRVSDEEQAIYEVRNELYRRYLDSYYHPARVARIFFMAGQFDLAIKYLENQPGIRTNRRLRGAFLDGVAASMYAARSVADAAERLADHLVRAFDITGAAIFVVSADRARLERISVCGNDSAPAIELTSTAAPQVSVYRDGRYKMHHERQRLTIALSDRNDVRFGVVDLHGYRGDAQSDDFGLLLAFVRQVGWALGNVLERERRIDQLQTLEETARTLSASLDLDRVLQTVVEAGTRAIPGAQRGLVLLYDKKQDVLSVHAQKGFRPTFKDEIRLRPGEGYVGKVFQSGTIMSLPDAQNDARVLLRNDEDVRQQKSVLCVPLSAWGRPVGVFVVDNVTEKAAFRHDDVTLLSAFAAQAAAALQNAMVYRELYELSLEVNRGDLDRKEIFRLAVTSIVHVTAATAANMLLLRDADDPERAITLPPIDSVAYGMSDSFEQDIRPRPGGMTFTTLAGRKPCICTSPGGAPGIHPLATALGVQASIALPLMLQDQPLGVLFVHFRERHEFPPDEVKILSIFANLCAKAIENARHAEQLRVHASVAWMGLDLSEMSHSLAQAMPPIRSGLSALKTHIAGNESALQVLQKTDLAVDSLASLPRRAVLPRDEDIRPVEVTALIKAQIEEWCKAHPTICPDLSQLGERPVHVECDPRRLAKVFKSLIQNAVRTAKLSAAPRFSVNLKITRRTVEVTLTNSGPEIPAEIRKDLFKQPVRSSGHGQGVGLLIARSIVIGYGGELELIGSRPDDTTFRISLPLLLAPSDDKSKERP